MSNTVDLLAEKGYTFLDVEIGSSTDQTYGKYGMKLIVEDQDGYLYKETLERLLNEKKRKPKLVWFGNQFNLRNISRYLYVNQKSYVLCEGNYFVDPHWELKVRCLNCNEEFYISWDFIQMRYCQVADCGRHQLSPYSTTSLDGIIEYKDEECNRQAQSEQTENGYFESSIATELKQYCINRYGAFKEFDECINPETNRFLPYDIFISQYKLYIEIHGSQHYERGRDYNQTAKDLVYQQYKDRIKKEHAESNGVYMVIDLREVTTIDQAIACVENLIDQLEGGQN